MPAKLPVPSVMSETYQGPISVWAYAKLAESIAATSTDFIATLLIQPQMALRVTKKVTGTREFAKTVRKRPHAGSTRPQKLCAVRPC
ncbi:hypothetical protein D3C86_1870820 [compost metagenome]